MSSKRDGRTSINKHQWMFVANNTWLWDAVVKFWDLSAKSKVSWREDSRASAWFWCNWSSLKVGKLNLPQGWAMRLVEQRYVSWEKSLDRDWIIVALRFTKQVVLIHRSICSFPSIMTEHLRPGSTSYICQFFQQDLPNDSFHLACLTSAGDF